VQKISIIKPDDFHLHIRDHAAMASAVAHTAQQFARALIMPNLQPPITTVAMAKSYSQRITASLPKNSSFTPLMSLYLTDQTTPEDIKLTQAEHIVKAVKLYPAGATTHSDAGVTDLTRVYDTLSVMEKIGLPLLIHGETTDPTVDVFDREKVFIEKKLQPLVERFPHLKIVLEHITTQEAVDFILNAPPHIAATITAHHLLLNRNAIFQGGIRPHHYCLPLLKREHHRQALLTAATSGNGKFFLGTDSAPHSQFKKENHCGCAGIFTAHAAMELYAEAFDSVGALHQLEAFASINGAKFYGLEINKERITIEQKTWIVAENYPFAGEVVIPFRANKKIYWQVIH